MLPAIPDAEKKRIQFLAEIGSNSHFNCLFDHIPGILFFVKNSDGHILFANLRLVQLPCRRFEPVFPAKRHRMSVGPRRSDVKLSWLRTPGT